MYNICLLPILLITGPFLPDLMVSLICLYFIFFLSKKKRKELIYNKYIYFFLLFYVVLILSSLLSDYKLLSLKTSVAYIRFGTLILINAYLITVKKNILNLCFYILVSLFILLFIYSLYQNFWRKYFGFLQ